MAAHFHFTENTLALHFLFKRAKCLIDVIITYNNFYQRNYLLPVHEARFIRLNPPFVEENMGDGQVRGTGDEEGKQPL